MNRKWLIVIPLIIIIFAIIIFFEAFRAGDISPVKPPPPGGFPYMAINFFIELTDLEKDIN